MYNLAQTSEPTFIDLFSGCGGLSLGLSQAGWKGLFAVERATDAFETFRANFLCEKARYPFRWPSWLEQGAHSIDDVLTNHRGELQRLCGKVDLIAGGPPCQGFSFAGKRKASDPRNRMFERYVAFVELIQPKFLVLENVPGMNVVHAGRSTGKRSQNQTYYTKLLDALRSLGYEASGGMLLDSAEFGVPQRRARLVVVGMRSDVAKRLPTGYAGVFEGIRAEGVKQLGVFGGKHVSAKDAISDLAVGTGKAKIANTIEYAGEWALRGYLQRRYVKPLTKYQEVMNEGVSAGRIDSMRLARHRPDVEERFGEILDRCRRGVNLAPQDREDFGMLKHRTIPMDPKAPSPTLTTLPDDILHYEDPGILTVRECARIQSFPDWFEFKGKYTTGGDLRRVECPRYTQVGNAVPPMLARAIGMGLLGSWRAATASSDRGIANGRKVRLVKKVTALAVR